MRTRTPLTSLPVVVKHDLVLTELRGPFSLYIPDNPFTISRHYYEEAKKKDLACGAYMGWATEWPQLQSLEESSDISLTTDPGYIHAFVSYSGDIMNQVDVNVALSIGDHHDLVILDCPTIIRPPDFLHFLKLRSPDFRDSSVASPLLFLPREPWPRPQHPLDIVQQIEQHGGVSEWCEAWTEGIICTKTDLTRGPSFIYVLVSSARFGPSTPIVPITVLQKRFKTLAISPLVSNTPSQGGKPADFSARQRGDGKFLCGRPLEASPFIPPSLYSKVFADALDDIHEQFMDVDLDLYQRLDTEMRTIFTVEKERMDKFRTIMRDFGFELLISHTGGGTHTDGDCWRGAGTGGAQPFFEAMLYALKGFFRGLDAGLVGNFPCLLTCVVGNSIAIYGCVFVDRPITQLLDEFTFGYDTSDEKHCLRGIQFCQRLRLVLEALKREATDIITPQTGQPHPPLAVLTRSSFAFSPSSSLSFTYSDSEEQELYKSRLFPACLDHFPNRKILVKFTQRYGVRAHAAAFALGAAPELLGYEELSGGWKMVVMVDLREDYSDFTSSKAADTNALARSKIREFHEKGYVHGDLRGANLMAHRNGNAVALIDFDWAGEAGQVSYPLNINLAPALKRPSSVRPGRLMTTEHDRIMLDTFLPVVAER
ncbi:hypothetical protein MVEN_01510900 [Mycena venus]|uniref:Protein kinase domain-containing protein n=1 Tax=Mycena venus TaxID=2733690 RepID=A0A8H7CRI4_9AGAR|nr:hypothetical protein MVEN_01510900 [Mycena venus]